jgi:hypothetical protein
MYENMGYTAAAKNMYEQAVDTLAEGISTLAGAGPDDALFHLGACQLSLGCLCHTMGNAAGCRKWIQAALPHLQEAWRRFPGNPWYQQALVRASILLGRIAAAREVREQSPKSAAVEKIGGLIDRATIAWERLTNESSNRSVGNPANWAQPSTDWSAAVMSDVFKGSPSWIGVEEK